ncbi:MAG: membrane protein insertase YidC [Bacillus sp. (in: firmicutes)]
MDKSNKAVSLAFKGFLFLFGVFVLSSVFGGEHALAASGADASPGFFQTYFVQPFTLVLDTVAEWFQGSYGMSIIFVTLLIRLLVLPLMVKSTKQQLVMKDKMAVIQPEMKVIQDKLKKATTPEDKMKVQQEMMQLYQKHNFNPLSSLSGCLPILIQMPFLMGFYYAIRGSSEMATHSFLWFDLGQSDIILAALAAGIYLLQAKVSLSYMPEEQRKQMAIVSYMSPIMMGFISLTAPAALPLYWTVSGCFVMIQTYFIRKIYHNKPAAQEAETLS